ncbi:MAG TPA: hypothetical protein VIO11_04015 [Candidatus Methanoperedens sp.]
MPGKDHKQFADELRKNKYIDNYIDRWLKLETTDKPYVECEICGYISNASIHQHLLIPDEIRFENISPGDNRIMHLCSNCNYELRALIDRYRPGPENIKQISEDAFEKLKEKKKQYREMNQKLDRIEI